MLFSCLRRILRCSKSSLSHFRGPPGRCLSIKLQSPQLLLNPFKPKCAHTSYDTTPSPRKETIDSHPLAVFFPLLKFVMRTQCRLRALSVTIFHSIELNTLDQCRTKPGFWRWNLPPPSKNSRKNYFLTRRVFLANNNEKFKYFWTSIHVII